MDLIESHDGQENFRFGNGGLVTSSRRWRLPALVNSKLILVWISIVPVGTLGCLLGRDFLNAVGGVLDFAAKTLQCTFLSSEAHPQRLNQMSAGHFILPLIPKGWPRPLSGRWRHCGLDGMIELQMAPQQWLDRKLSSRVSNSSVCSHDQMLTEGCGTAGAVHEVLSVHHYVLVQDMTAPADRGSLRQHPLREVCSADPRDLFQACQRGSSGAVHSGISAAEPDGTLQVGICSVPVAPMDHAAHRKIRLACRKFAGVAFATLLLVVLALSIPFNRFSGGLEISSQDHGRPAGDGPLPLVAGSRQWSLHLTESSGVVQVPRSCGMEVCVHEKLHSEWLDGCQSFPWNFHEVEDSSPRRSSSCSGEGEEARTSNASRRRTDWSTWRATNFESRPDQTGSSL